MKEKDHNSNENNEIVETIVRGRKFSKLPLISGDVHGDLPKSVLEIDKEICKIEHVIDNPTFGKIYCPICPSGDVDCEIELYDEESILQCVCLECGEFWCIAPEEDIQELRDRLAGLIRKRKDFNKRIVKF